MVMETIPGKCDLFGGPQVCLDYSRGLHHEPEHHVREAILSLMTPCLWRNCSALDIGANVGQFTVMMAALGSRVVAVEGQIVLAKALKQTVEVNCFSDVTVHNALVALDELEHGKKVNHRGQGGRPIMASHPASSWTTLKDNCCTSIPGEIEFFSWKKLLLDHPQAHIDLIKLDIDSFEYELLVQAVEQISLKQLTVTSIISELRGFDRKHLDLFNSFFSLGYNIYVLNVHLDKRWIDSNGMDVYQRFKNINSLYNLSGVEEVFSQRLIRYALRILPEVTLEGIKTVGKGTRDILFTKEQLAEPIFEYPYKVERKQGTTFETAGMRLYDFKNSIDGLSG